jgi:homoserine dehydrogenase
MGDVCDIARGINLPVFGQPATTLRQAPAARSTVAAPYYLRMELADKPGALAKVATLLGEAGISIDRMRQTGHTEGSASVLIVTHRCTRDALDSALDAMPGTGVLTGTPVALRIEKV